MQTEIDGNRYEYLRQLIQPHLGPDDDLAAWWAIVERIIPDAEYLCNYNPESKFIAMRIGCCSRWVRPHQTRWTAAGGFAWPSGYNGRLYSREGLPQHDWEARLFWYPSEMQWRPADPRRRYKQRQLLEFRVSIPARTRRHGQAAIFTTWLSGSPPLPKQPIIQLYGFRRLEEGWQCTATSEFDNTFDAACNLVSKATESG